MKYFALFLLYSLLTSVYVVFLMLLSFYKLLSSRKPKLHMNHKNYPAAFIICVLTFVTGLIFAYFTSGLLSELLESIELNQS
jgi:uncharacterized membrane protein YfcA